MTWRRSSPASFAAVPDFHAELLRAVDEGDTGWTEWHWTGTRGDGSRLDLRGMTVFGVRDDRFAWGCLYMEETEVTGEDIDARMQELTRPS